MSWSCARTTSWKVRWRQVYREQPGQTPAYGDRLRSSSHTQSANTHTHTHARKHIHSHTHTHIFFFSLSVSITTPHEHYTCLHAPPLSLKFRQCSPLRFSAFHTALRSPLTDTTSSLTSDLLSQFRNGSLALTPPLRCESRGKQPLVTGSCSWTPAWRSYRQRNSRALAPISRDRDACCGVCSPLHTTFLEIFTHQTLENNSIGTDTSKPCGIGGDKTTT